MTHYKLGHSNQLPGLSAADADHKGQVDGLEKCWSRGPMGRTENHNEETPPMTPICSSCSAGSLGLKGSSSSPASRSAGALGLQIAETRGGNIVRANPRQKVSRRTLLD